MNFNPKPGTKRHACLALLNSKRGCTLADGEAATSWKPNVVASKFYFLAALNERKLVKTAPKKGARRYRLAWPQTPKKARPCAGQRTHTAAKAFKPTSRKSRVASHYADVIIGRDGAYELAFAPCHRGDPRGRTSLA